MQDIWYFRFAAFPELGEMKYIHLQLPRKTSGTVGTLELGISIKRCYIQKRLNAILQFFI